MITLRQHQIDAIADVDGRKGNVLCVLPTGSGKSYTLADYARRYLNQGEITVVPGPQGCSDQSVIGITM